MRPLDAITRITEIRPDDYSWYILTDIYHVVVWNPIFYQSPKGDMEKMTNEISQTIRDIGAKVSSDDEWVVFELTDGGKVKVSIKADDYNGPEAMFLMPIHATKHPFVVI